MKNSAALVVAKATVAVDPSTTIIPSTAPPAQAPADPIEAFAAQCEARALLLLHGQLNLHEAVDELQVRAERIGLVDQLGQDAVQLMMSDAFAPPAIEPAIGRDFEPPAIDPVSPPPASPAGSTVATFWFLVSLGSSDRLHDWLALHTAADVAALRKLLDTAE